MDEHKKRKNIIQNPLKSNDKAYLKLPETPHFLTGIPITQPLVYYPQHLETFRDTTNDFDTRYLQFGLGKPLPDSQSDEFQSFSLQSQAPMVLSDTTKEIIPTIKQNQTSCCAASMIEETPIIGNSKDPFSLEKILEEIDQPDIHHTSQDKIPAVPIHCLQLQYFSDAKLFRLQNLIENPEFISAKTFRDQVFVAHPL
jgi:hypothetical protein